MCNSNNTLPMSSPEEHSKTTIKASNKDVETPHSSFFESLPESVKFMTLTASMFVFFGTHNILQEAMIKMPNFKYGVMLGYMEVFGYVFQSLQTWSLVLRDGSSVLNPNLANTCCCFCL